jgi:hypothetical protein
MQAKNRILRLLDLEDTMANYSPLFNKSPLQLRLLGARGGRAFDESPRISMRWALCTSLSRMPSANVGSPICSCQRVTGNCEVRI